MTNDPNTAPAPKPKTVETETLRANPHNPRMLFDRLPLKELEDSIRRNGILVPLTVYRASGSSQYTILDGQRRWMCAKAIGLNSVPVNEVAEPSTAENIITMFQIHKLRKDWELMPTALKVEVLIEELNQPSDKQLSVITGLDQAVIVRCKKLLSFENNYREMMLYADPKDRIKADFFIELYPVLTDRVLKKAKIRRSLVIERMLFKYLNKKSDMKSITDFRKIKSFVAIARSAGREIEIINRYRKFIEDDNFSINDLEINTAKIHKTASGLRKQSEKLRESLYGVVVQEFLGEEDFWEELEDLARLITKKAADAGRRRIA